jgi:hypothetical protein
MHPFITCSSRYLVSSQRRCTERTMHRSVRQHSVFMLFMLTKSPPRPSRKRCPPMHLLLQYLCHVSWYQAILCLAKQTAHEDLGCDDSPGKYCPLCLAFEGNNEPSCRKRAIIFPQRRISATGAWTSDSRIRTGATIKWFHGNTIRHATRNK